MKRIALIIALIIALTSFSTLVVSAETGVDISGTVDSGAGEPASPAPLGTSADGSKAFNLGNLPCAGMPFYFYEIASFNVISGGKNETLHVWLEKDDGNVSLFIADNDGKTIIPADGNAASSKSRSYSRQRSFMIRDDEFSLLFSSNELSVESDGKNISMISGVDSISNIRYFDEPGFGADITEPVTENNPVTTEDNENTDDNAASEEETEIEIVDREGGSAKKKILIAAVVALVLLLAAAVAVAFLFKNKKDKSEQGGGDGETEPAESPAGTVEAPKPRKKAGIPVGTNDPVKITVTGREINKPAEKRGPVPGKPVAATETKRKEQVPPTIDGNPVSGLDKGAASANAAYKAAQSKTAEVDLDLGFPDSSAPSSLSEPIAPAAPVNPAASAVQDSNKSPLHNDIMAYYAGKSGWNFGNNGIKVELSNAYGMQLSENPIFKVNYDITDGYAVFDNRFLYLYTSNYIGSSFKLYSTYQCADSIFEFIKDGKPVTLNAQDIEDIEPATVRMENDTYVLEKKGRIYLK